MKHPLYAFAFLLVFFMAPAVAYADASVEGRWHTPKAEGIVEIAVANGVLSGKLVASTHKEAKLGTVILRDFVRKGAVWKGKIYVPKRDKLLDAELTARDGKLSVKVSAGLRSKTVTWNRPG